MFANRAPFENRRKKKKRSEELEKKEKGKGRGKSLRINFNRKLQLRESSKRSCVQIRSVLTHSRLMNFGNYTNVSPLAATFPFSIRRRISKVFLKTVEPFVFAELD